MLLTYGNGNSSMTNQEVTRSESIIKRMSMCVNVPKSLSFPSSTLKPFQTKMRSAAFPTSSVLATQKPVVIWTPGKNVKEWCVLKPISVDIATASVHKASSSLTLRMLFWLNEHKSSQAHSRSSVEGRRRTKRGLNLEQEKYICVRGSDVQQTFGHTV